MRSDQTAQARLCYNWRMDDAELERYIITRLGNAANENDLILEICETRGVSWPEAEALVRRVAADREPAIAGRRLPVLFIIALIIFTGGLALVIYESSILISALETAIDSGFQSLDTLTGLVLIFNTAISHLTGIAIGAAMMLGSLVGMRQAWVPLIEHLWRKESR